jgi:two-component system sensor histidine kinase BaeS
MSKRIIGTIVGVVVATLLLAGTGTFVLARVATTRDDVASLETKAEQTSQLFAAFDQDLPRNGDGVRIGALAASSLRRNLLDALSVSGIGTGYVGPRGRFVGDLPAGVDVADLDLPALAGGATRSGRSGDVLWAAAASTETSANGRQVTVVTVLTQPRERFFGPTFRWFLLSAAAALVLAVVASVLLGRRLGRPLADVAAATGRIAHGDLTARLPDPPPADDDELATLARSVNAMGEALQRAKDQERHFLMSVSHDLRTPLTSIRGYAEAIADGAADDPARAATVIVGESRRLERLVGDLLDLARIDADRFDLSSVPADVVDIVAGTVEGFGPELRDAGLVLHHSLDRAQPVVAVVDVDRLAQVVANLTTNAIDFARTAVWADVHVEAGEACIQISDDGPGIPPASLGRVFDRLYQADNQPTRRGRGTGLGLAIVAELAARMGGRCDVTSVEGRGTTFTVRLPLASR